MAKKRFIKGQMFNGKLIIEVYSCTSETMILFNDKTYLVFKNKDL
jgi:hypothetical protein